MPEGDVIPADERRLLVDFRRKLQAVTTAPDATARLVVAPDVARLRSLAVFPGAFNPPTEAHLALARTARKLGFDAVCFALGSVLLAKPAGAGLVLEDRLLLLRALASEETGLGVLIHNRGLYADQAEAVRKVLPDVEDLAFLVGADKLSQLFDPTFYDDMEEALGRFFRLARLLVAPRGDVPEDVLRNVISHHLDRRLADRIGELPLGPHWMHLSSATVRERLERGEDADDELPDVVRSFLARTRPFGPGPEAYEERAARIRHYENEEEDR